MYSAFFLFLLRKASAPLAIALDPYLKPTLPPVLKGGT
jgi:hypothetical protein